MRDSVDDTVNDWEGYRSLMNKCYHLVEPQINELLDFVKHIRVMVNKILERPLSYASERPQDFVMAFLVTRSFRLFISSLNLSLSGYPDSTPNIERTIFEINLRFLQIKKDPLKASLGFLLHSIDEELEPLKFAMEFLDISDKHLLEINILNLEKYYHDVERIINDLNFDPQKLKKIFGKLNVANTLSEFPIAYKITYKNMCGFSHEKLLANFYFYEQTDVKKKFLLGPTISSVKGHILDSFIHIFSTLAHCFQIINETDLTNEFSELEQKFISTYEDYIKNNME